MPPRKLPLGISYDDRRATYRIGVTLDDGTRIQRRAATLDEARRVLAELELRKSGGIITPTDRLSVSEWLDSWLAAVAPTLDRNSARRYREQIDRRLRPAIGHLRLSALRTPHIEQVIAQAWDAGLSASTIELTWVVVNAALSRAVALGYLLRNPAAGVKRPRAGSKAAPYARQAVTLSEQQTIALLTAAAPERLFALFLLAIVTGARRGELLALRWSEIDFEGGRLTIAAKLSRLEHGFAIEPRRKAGGQPVTVALPPFAVEALRRHKGAQAAERLAAPAWADLGLVFASRRGTPTTPDNLVRVFRRVVRAANAGLAEARAPIISEHIRLHDLRHTAATFYRSLGAGLDEIQRILGHADIATTARYAHVTERIATDRAAQIERLVRPETG